MAAAKSATDKSAAFKKLLFDCRSIFGAPPRKFGLMDKRYNRMSLPFLMRFVGGKTLKPIYDDRESLLSNGIVVWGYVVQANTLLYEPGDLNSAGQIIFSLDPIFEGRVDVLGGIAQNILALMEADPPPKELVSFYNALHVENIAVFNRSVPKKMCYGKNVYLTTFMLHRKHLPVNYIKHNWFPLLVNPKYTRACLVMPSRYWSTTLINYWKNGN